MKSQLKNTPIALAVAALFLSPVAFADSMSNDGGGRDRNHDPVSIKKEISVKQDVEQKGRVNVTGQIYIDASSMAVVNDAQSTSHNQVDNNLVTNDATISGNALNAAKGNIGLNVSSGDNNQQANAAALSAADASFVFGSSDAEVFANQSASSNHTTNLANDLAESVAVARMATATVQANQSNGNNTTSNSPIQTETTEYRQVSLALNAGGTYWGGGLGGYSGSASGTTAGTSDQIGNVYPDIWTGSSHPGGVADGHFDLDTQTQGGSDLNGDGGALAFKDKGTYSGSEHGTLGFQEAGWQSLSGTVTGMVPVVVSVNVATTNTSFLGDNALQNASGNIGVNIASGTNNQQFNGLAMSATQAGAGTGGGSGGE
jgi:hypothetical protein